MVVESRPFYPSKLISNGVVPLRLQEKEKDLDLTSNCDLESNTILLGEAWRMRQISTTLVENAFKLTDGGSVNLTVYMIGNGRPGITMV
jgi:hypothetical protein